MAGINLPTIKFTAEDLDDERQRRKIMGWLYKLTEQLNFALNNIDEDNLSDAMNDVINSKASAETVSELGNGVTRVQTEVRQNAGAIALKASQTELDSLGEQVAANTAEIALTPEKITAAVTGDLTPSSVAIGSSITMDADHTEISTPYLDIDVSGTSGDMHIDEDGISASVATFDSINCDAVVKRVAGRDITITSPGGLQEELNRINGAQIDGSETITLACDQYGDVTMRGIYGNDTSLTIAGAYAINGQLWITDCHVQYLDIDGVTVNCTAAHAVLITGSDVRMDNCTINGGSSYAGVKAATNSRIMLNAVAIYGTQYGVWGDWMNSFFLQNLKGTPTVAYWVRGCTAIGSGTRPSGECWVDGSIVTPSSLSSLTIDTGSGETPPEAVTTVSYTASTTGTYYPSGHWIGDNIIRQGYEGSTNGRKDYGTMWFSGASALSGKTIKSATLTLKRISGKGRSSAVTVKLWSTTVTGKSGTMPSSSMTSLGELGSIGNGETVTFTIPTSCISGLASGGGLVLYTEETTCKTGKSYSEHYAHFEGVDGAAPVLTVTYQ